MKKKRFIALILVSASILVGVIAFWLSYHQGVSRNTTLVMIYLSGALTGVLGSILLFTTVLDGYVVPVIEDLVEDTLDDREDLKRGRITFVHISGLLVIFVTIGFAYLTIVFSKFSATWGGIPVVIPTLIILSLATWFLTKSRWFITKSGRTPPLLFIILLIGLVLSPAIGITKTENLSRALSTPVGEYQYDYRVEQAMSLATENGLGVVDFSLGIFSECDSDECFWVVVIVLVVVVSLILLTGSAYITHFWFFSGSIFLCGMWIIFIRELRVRPNVGVI